MKAPTLRELVSMSDKEFLDRADQLAQSTVVGLDWFREELVRRATERAARQVFWLTVVVAVAAVSQAIAALGVWLRLGN